MNTTETTYASLSPTQLATAFVIGTQYRENYGAHEWDGTGRCPQYWKDKGGYDYIVVGAANEEAAVAAAEANIPAPSEYSEEYVISVNTHARWQDRLPEEQDYRDHIIEMTRIIVITP